MALGKAILIVNPGSFPVPYDDVKLVEIRNLVFPERKFYNGSGCLRSWALDRIQEETMLKHCSPVFVQPREQNRVCI